MMKTDVKLSMLLLRNVFTRILGILRNILVLPILDPASLGIYRYILTILGYSNILHFGSVTYLTFKYSEFKKDEKLLIKCKQFALYGVYIGSFISFILCVLLIKDSFSLPQKILIGFLSSLSLCSLYILLLLRVQLQFNQMAIEDIISQIIGFILFVILGYFYGLIGFIAGGQLGFLYMIFKYRSELIIIRPVEHLITLLPQIKYSINLWISSLMNQLTISFDIIILKLILQDRREEFGYYAFCAMIAATVNSVLGILIEVQGQQILEKYSEIQTIEDVNSSNVTREIIDLTIKDSIIASFLVLVANLTIFLVIYFFLPKYLPTLDIISFFMLSVLILRWRNYFVIVMNKTNNTFLASKASFFGVFFTVFYPLVLLLNKSTSLFYLSIISILTYLVVIFFVLYYYHTKVQRLEINKLFCNLLLILVPCSLNPLYAIFVKNLQPITSIYIVLFAILFAPPFYYLSLNNYFRETIYFIKNIK